MDQKVNVFLFYFIFDICTKMKVLKKTNFDQMFFWLHFLISLVVTLNFSKHVCNGVEKEESDFALRNVHVFVHPCEECCGH